MNSKLTQAIACLAVSPLLWQCSTEDELLPDSSASAGKTVTLTVKGGGDVFTDPETKTSLAADGRVLWTEGDYVYINGTRYEVIPDQTDPSKGTVKNVQESEEYVAVYSDNRGYWPGNESVNIYFRSYQDYASGTFASFDNPMVAYSTGSVLEFKNIGGILRLGITGNGQSVRKVMFTADDGAGVAGTVTIPADDLKTGLKDSYAEFSYEPSSSKTIGIYPEDGISVTLGQEPEYFHFVLPAQTYRGFTVTVEDMDGNVGVQRMNGSVDIRRSALVPMQPFEFEPLPTPEITVTGSTANSVSCTIKTEPGMQVIAGVVYGALYDAMPEYDPEEGITKYAYALTALYDSEHIETSGDDGICEFTISDVYNINNGYVPMVSGTDYYIVAAYYMEEDIMGMFPVREFSTSQVSGSGPVLEMTVAENTYSSAVVNIRTGADAVNLTACMMTESEYQSYKDSYGLEGRDLLLAVGDVLDEEDLAAAKEGGYRYDGSWWSTIYPSTSYVFLSMAVSDTGGETIEKLEFTTPEHFPQDVLWETVPSESIEFSFSRWSDDGSTRYEMTLQGGIMEKMTGREIYRVSCDFSQADFASYMESLGCNPDGTSGESWVYMDVSEGKNNIRLYPDESYIGYDSPEGDPLFLVSDGGGYWYDYGDRIAVSSSPSITSDAQDYDKHVVWSLAMEIAVYYPVTE